MKQGSVFLMTYHGGRQDSRPTPRSGQPKSTGALIRGRVGRATAAREAHNSDRAVYGHGPRNSGFFCAAPERRYEDQKQGRAIPAERRDVARGRRDLDSKKNSLTGHAMKRNTAGRCCANLRSCQSATSGPHVL